MDKKAVKFIAVTILGLALAQYGSELAYRQRGYHAIGGEILILPCVYLIAYGLPYMMKGLLEIINNDFEDFDDQEDDENGSEQKGISENKKNGSQGAVELHWSATARSTKRSA